MFGWATARSGTTYGVYGRVASPTGYGVFSAGRFKATGRTFLGIPEFGTR